MSITRKSKALVLAAAITLYAATPVTWANGNPNKEYGAHDYQLLIIGMNDTDGKLGNGGVDNGKRIFVRLSGKTKILLTEGDDYDVIDADGTDGTARFQLPNPDPDGDGETVYRVYVRALGGPTGSATITSCAEDAGGAQWCSTASAVIMRESNGPGNKPHWQNESRHLLYLQIDIDGDGRLELVPLFDDRLENYYWYYDNNGLRVAQFRFYAVPQDVCEELGWEVVEGECQEPA